MSKQPVLTVTQDDLDALDTAIEVFDFAGEEPQRIRRQLQSLRARIALTRPGELSVRASSEVLGQISEVAAAEGMSPDDLLAEVNTKLRESLGCGCACHATGVACTAAMQDRCPGCLES